MALIHEIVKWVMIIFIGGIIAMKMKQVFKPKDKEESYNG